MLDMLDKSVIKQSITNFPINISLEVSKIVCWFVYYNFCFYSLVKFMIVFILLN